MGMGADLSAFGDLMLFQGPAFLSGADDLVNLANKRTFTMTRFIQGKDIEEMIQGGSKIKDEVLFNAKSDYQHYKPNQSFDYSNPQVFTEWEVDWRFTTDNMQWTDHEIGLNSGEMSRKAKIHRFKNLKRKLEMNQLTNFLNKMDSECWAVPNSTKMEGGSGTDPYSIPVFVNELSNASDPAAAATGKYATWTGNVMNLDPAFTGFAGGKWQNERASYSDVASASTSNLFQALSLMFYRLHYDRLPRRPELGEASTWPNFIATSLGGIIQYERLLRISQDFFLAGRQDPAFPNPTFRGVPLVYIDDLDTALIFPTGAAGALASESNAGTWVGGTNKAGPRYFVLTGQYFVMVVHSERWFWKKRVELPRQPFNNVIVVDCWHNFLCRARNRQGIIYPTADINPGT